METLVDKGLAKNIGLRYGTVSYEGNYSVTSEGIHVATAKAQFSLTFTATPVSSPRFSRSSYTPTSPRSLSSSTASCLALLSPRTRPSALRATSSSAHTRVRPACSNTMSSQALRARTRRVRSTSSELTHCDSPYARSPCAGSSPLGTPARACGHSQVEQPPAPRPELGLHDVRAVRGGHEDDQRAEHQPPRESSSLSLCLCGCSSLNSLRSSTTPSTSSLALLSLPRCILQESS